jgi:hypothetical protein
MLLNFIFLLLQKKCENCAATSDASKMTTSVSKLKRKLVSNTQSPAATQTKQARVTSCDKFASRPAEVSRSKPGQVTFYHFLAKVFKIGAQILDARLPWQLNFVWWHLILICVWILSVEHPTCHHGLELWHGSYTFRKFVHPWFKMNLLWGVGGAGCGMSLQASYREPLNAFQWNLNFRVYTEWC